MTFLIWIGLGLVFAPFLNVLDAEYALLAQKFVSLIGGAVVVIVLGIGVVLLGRWLRWRLFYLRQTANGRSPQRGMSELRADHFVFVSNIPSLQNIMTTAELAEKSRHE